MIHDRVLQILTKIKDLTHERQLKWVKDPDDWFTAGRDQFKISFRLMFFEATNQVGANPRSFQLVMPGLSWDLHSELRGLTFYLRSLRSPMLGIGRWKILILFTDFKPLNRH